LKRRKIVRVNVVYNFPGIGKFDIDICGNNQRALPIGAADRSGATAKLKVGNRQKG
jgi:hypothetical protein